MLMNAGSEQQQGGFERCATLTRSKQSRAVQIESNNGKVLAESSNLLEGTKYLAK